MQEEKIIQVRGLTKAFGTVKALDHCDMEVKRGEIFGYLGPSGAGKTTTIKLLTGQMHSDAGEMMVLGESPFSLGIRSQIGIMSDTSGLYEKMTVYENLALFADIYQVSKDRVNEVLEAVELQDSRKKKVEKLSRGMKQRLVFARTIIHKPALLFLDEPTANLDPMSAEEVRELIRQLNEEGTTIFLTTHNMEEADELCDRIALLNCGSIMECGNPEKLKLKYSKHKVVVTTAEKEIEIPLDCDSIMDVLQNNPEILMIHSQEPSLKEVFIALTNGGLK